MQGIWSAEVNHQPYTLKLYMYLQSWTWDFLGGLGTIVQRLERSVLKQRERERAHFASVGHL